jgi:integrase
MHSTQPPPAKKAAKKKRARLKLGSTTIVIQRLKGGRTALVTYSPGDKPNTRRREKVEYETLAAAQTAFEMKERELEKVGAQAAGRMEDADRIAVSDFKAATGNWTPAPTIAEALAFYLDHKRALSSSGTVADAIDRRNTDALRRGLSARHREDLDLRLAKLKTAMGGRPLASVTSECLRQWLAGLGVSTATQRNYLKIAGSVFALAVDEGRIVTNPAAKVKLAKVVGDEPGTLPAENLGIFLTALDPRSLATFAIQALAGVRRAEAARLKWDEVKLDQGVIVIGAQAAKTASRRLIPISPALAAWLALCPDQKGKVAPPVGTVRFDLDNARKAAGIESWPQNCLRHSCISGWAATESDLAKVAGWAGHAVQVLHQHYRALWTAQQGQVWHLTMPPTAKVAPKRGLKGEPAQEGGKEQAAPLADVIMFRRSV